MQIKTTFFFTMDRKRKAYLLFQNVMTMSRKRQRKELDSFEELYSSLEDLADDDDIDDDIMGTISYATALATTSNNRCGGKREKPVNRTQQKELWSLRYVNGNWDENGFKARVRVTNMYRFLR